MRVYFCLFYSLLISVFITETSARRPKKKYKYIYQIGGLYEKESSFIAYNLSINFQSAESISFKPVASIIDETDSFATLKKACSLTMNNQGVVAIIRDFGSFDALSTVCSRISVPELMSSYMSTIPKKFQETNFFPYRFHYYPSATDISRAIAKLVAELEWTEISILYEDPESLSRLQEVLKNQAAEDKPTVYFHRLEPSGDNKPIFKKMYDKQHNKVILDCHRDRIIDYLNQTVEANNKTDYQSYILTSLDAHTLDFSEVDTFLANVSTFHLIDPNDYAYKELVRIINREMGEAPDKDIMLDSILASDATKHLMAALMQLQKDNMQSENIHKNYESISIPALCNNYTNMEVWEDGLDLVKKLRNVSIEGTSGLIQFDNNNKRTNYRLYISELNEFNFKVVGFWNSTDDTYIRTSAVSNVTRQDKLGGSKTIKIGSTLGEPYFFKTNSSGNDIYEGYVVDLMAEIAAHIKTATGENFTYSFYNNPGGQSALIQDILENKAELAIGDMTITHARSMQVDFSQPFMDLGISILFQKPEIELPNRYAFMLPLNIDLWLGLVTTYLIISFILFVCARMSQDDWVNPHPCDRKPQTLENIWNLYNSTWITMGTIMTQGCDILPRAGGSRTVTAAWWFFALIITSCYTSNMSVFITNNRKNNEIQNVEDLAKQSKIKYGVLYDKSTYNFFKNSNETLFKKIFSVMQSTRPSVFCSSNEEGKDRVKRGKHAYAFFMESTTIEFYTQRNCDLKMVGGRIDAKEYGIAMSKNFPHRAKINNAIVSLQESGKLEELKKLWWEEKGNNEKCKEKEEEEEKNQPQGDSLQMENTSGIFFLLGYGSVIAVLVALYDYTSQSRKVAIKKKVDLKTAFKLEWKASLDLRTLNKPVDTVRALSEPPGDLPNMRSRPSKSRSILTAAGSFINLENVF